MELQNIKDCEHNRLEKFNRFYFPNKMKKVGLTISLISIALLVVNKLAWEQQILAHFLKTVFVLGLLIRGLSKEKLEDELMKSLRFYSFKYAFVAAIVFSLVVPYLDYFVDVIFSSVEIELKEDKGFFTVFQLVILQQIYFYMLKALYSEK